MRGLGRVAAGDPDGVTDLREALAGLREQGRGRGTGVTWLNYAFVRWELEGPAVALAENVEVGQFARRRRLRELVQAISCMDFQLLIELGRLGEAVAACERQLDMAGPEVNAARRIEAFAGLARAQYELGDASDPGAGSGGSGGSAARHAEQAYAIAVPEGWPDLIVVAAGAVALTRAAAGDAEGVREVLDRVVGLPENELSQEFTVRMPSLVRAGLAVGAEEPAARVAAQVKPTLPVREHAAASARALLAEYRGDLAAAATEYAAAATGWGSMGNRLEEAYALQGAGRCGSAVAATQAADLFATFR